MAVPWWFIGLSIIVVNGGSMFLTRPITELTVKYIINLGQGSFMFAMYKDPPTEAKSTFNIYYIKNPKEVLRGEKMSFGMKGPYHYRAKISRDHIVFKNEGQSVEFDTHLYLINDEHERDMDEKMWVLNPVVPATASLVRSILLDRLPFQSVSEPIVFSSVNVVLDSFGERLLMKTTPRDLLEGRVLTLLEIMVAVTDRLGLSNLLPATFPENKFGLAHAVNSTPENFEVWTGVSPTKHKYPQMVAWRKQGTVPYWRGQCAKINSSTAELHAPFMQTGKSVLVFLPQICRRFWFDPVDPHEHSGPGGLILHEYEITQRLFLGAKKNPRNKCFCPDLRTYDCQYDGLLLMGPCFFNVPLYFSRPNLLGVGKEIRNLIEFNSTEMYTHDKMSFYVEANTGATLGVNLTLMGLFKVVRQDYLRDMSRVQNLTYAPLFATTQTLEAPLNLAWPILMLQWVLNYHRAFNLVMIVVGSAIFIMGVMGAGSGKRQPAAAPVEPPTRARAPYSPSKSSTRSSSKPPSRTQSYDRQPSARAPQRAPRSARQ